MPADGMVTQIASKSVAILLTQLSCKIPVSAPVLGKVLVMLQYVTFQEMTQKCEHDS